MFAPETVSRISGNCIQPPWFDQALVSLAESFHSSYSGSLLESSCRGTNEAIVRFPVVCQYQYNIKTGREYQSLWWLSAAQDGNIYLPPLPQRLLGRDKPELNGKQFETPHSLDHLIGTRLAYKAEMW